MDGVLVVDKPQGLTSHDVVAAARRLLGERRIGHTGTLDPIATGVLPLVIGRATRLVRFLVSSEKEYVATIAFGATTDTYDATGTETSRSGLVPPRETVTGALRALTGSYPQMPPRFSAKKIAGRRAYDLARANRPIALRSVPVMVSRAELLEFGGGCARVALTCSAGFYVRSFAHALGELTGTGACLAALERTRSGAFTLEQTIPLGALEDAARVAAAFIPLRQLLSEWPAVTVSGRGLEDVAHGRELRAGDYTPAGANEGPRTIPADHVRLLDEDGLLVAVATPGGRPGSLHASVVLI